MKDVYRKRSGHVLRLLQVEALVQIPHNIAEPGISGKMVEMGTRELWFSSDLKLVKRIRKLDFIAKKTSISAHD